MINIDNHGVINYLVLAIGLHRIIFDNKDLDCVHSYSPIRRIYRSCTVQYVAPASLPLCMFSYAGRASGRAGGALLRRESAAVVL